MSLTLHVMRDERWVTSARVESLPFSIGSRPSADLVLDDPEVAGREGRVVLGHDGIPEFMGRSGGQRVPLKPGTHFRIGPFVVAAAPGADATSAGSDELLGELLAGLPALWDDSEGRPDPAGLVRLCCELFDASWGALVKLPEGRGAPEVVAQVGERPGGEVPLSRTVLDRVLASEEPILLEPGLEDGARVEAASIPLEVRSVLAAPLGKGRALEGLVYLESPRSRRTFTGAERATLVGLCELAAAHLAARRAAGRGVALGRLYQAEVRGHQELEGIVGSSPPMQGVLEQVRQAGPTDVTTLVLGESGTGKELVAGALHRLSPRVDGPFVAVNCAALPSELVESELFGHRKGAFSGAAEDRPGRFQLADGGTLFLDELADLPASAQAKLLRALETRSVQRLGGGPEESIDVRLVAATRADLKAEVEAGRFREDLFFRLGVFTIRVPPLRDRKQDLPDLVESLVGLLSRLHRRPVKGVTAQALELLRAHDWPGNVRELRNVLEQALVRARGEWIGPSDLGLHGAPGRSPGQSYPDELDAARALFERQHIGRILGEVSGDVGQAAARLGVARSSLYKRLKDLDLDPADFR